jgi:hypothetical protein
MSRAARHPLCQAELRHLIYYLLDDVPHDDGVMS